MNGEVLKALLELSDDETELAQYDALGTLPHFNPDHEASPPASVMEWRSQLQSAQAVIICSPEYAHGVPGSLKNALDWVVGSGEFMHKPVMLINASPSSHFAIQQLQETLSVMMAEVQTITLSMLGKKRDELSMRLDETVSSELRSVLEKMKQSVDQVRQ